MKRKRIAFIAFLSVLCSNEAMAQTAIVPISIQATENGYSIETSLGQLTTNIESVNGSLSASPMTPVVVTYESEIESNVITPSNITRQDVQIAISADAISIASMDDIVGVYAYDLAGRRVASVSANSTEVGIKKANLPMGELIIVVTTKRSESYASKILNK